MAEINSTNVSNIFERITGEGRSSTYADLISRSIAKVEGLLTVSTLTAAEAAKCEYAAAAEVVYQYALEGASAECFVQSENGSVRRGSMNPVTVQSADALRKYAFGELNGIAELRGFVFETAEG